MITALAPDAQTLLPRVPPPGPMTRLEAWHQVDTWLEPRIGRCRRQGRVFSVLRVVATPMTPRSGPLDTERLGQLLAACAHRLRASVRATDHVARVGEHGVAVLLDGATATGARAAAERLVRVCQGPYRIQDERLELCVMIDLDGAPPRG